MTRTNGHAPGRAPAPRRISWPEAVRRSAIGPVGTAVDRLGLTARNAAEFARLAAERAGEDPEETPTEG